MNMFKTKQTILPDIPAVITVFSFPLLMMILATGKGGVVMGLIIIVFFGYWIVVIYNKLYRKILIFDENNIVYENKEFSKTTTINLKYEDIKSFSISKNFLNYLTNSAKLVLNTSKEEEKIIELVNIIDPETFEELLKSKDLKKA